MSIPATRRPLWARWMLFVLISGAVAGTSAALFGLATGMGLEAICVVVLFTVLIGCVVSLVPGVAPYVLYEAVVQTTEPKWEYDDAGNSLFILGSCGPSILLILGVLNRAGIGSNPMQRPTITRLFGLSMAASAAVLFMFRSLELL